MRRTSEPTLLDAPRVKWVNDVERENPNSSGLGGLRVL
jgi:hypothetical protein